MPPRPRRRPPARLGSGVTPAASRDAEENALLDMRVLGQSSRPAARAAGPARGHTPKRHTGDAHSARARGLVRRIPARARGGALDEDHVSSVSVSLARAETDEPGGSEEAEGKVKKPRASSVSSPSADAGASGEIRDVARRVSSLRVAERSIARASSLAKLVDERHADEKRDSRAEPRTADAEEETPDDDARAAVAARGPSWSFAARAFGTHALFLEPRFESRDRTWDALVLSGIDAARLAERGGGRGDADATLRRSKTSPFAVSARRENARRHDRGRVVGGGFDAHEKKRLLRDAQRSSPYWRAVCRSDAELLTFAEAFEFVRYARGEHIVRAGDLADFALLVVEGEARLDAEGTSLESRVRADRRDKHATWAAKAAFGPGTVLGEMALFRKGGRRAAGVVACGSSAERGSGGESETDDDAESDAVSDNALEDAANGAAAREDAPPLAFPTSETRAETKTLHTYAVRVYFDAFVDFFAAHPVLATRAFGAFANAAARRLEQWRLLVSTEPFPPELDASGGRGEPKTRTGAKRRDERAREEKRFVRERFIGISFARAWSEDDRAAVASVARWVEARPGQLVFPSGAIASEFGVLLAGSTSTEDVDGIRSRREATSRSDDASSAASSFAAEAGSVVGAAAFAAALFRPAARSSAVVAGARGASVAVFDAAALELLDAARPGPGLELALAAARAAATRPPSLDASAFAADDDEASRAFLPSAPEAEVCFPPDAQPRPPRWRSSSENAKSRESDVLRASEQSASNDAATTSTASKDVRAERRVGRTRARVARALRAAFAAAGAEESPAWRAPSSRELRVLAESCATLRFDVGQQILRPGDRAAFAGVLVAGSAAVVDAEGRVSASLGFGAVIGESGAFGATDATRRDAVISGEDDTVAAVWTPEALRVSARAPSATKTTDAASPPSSDPARGGASARAREGSRLAETPDRAARVAPRAARMFVFLCAYTAARRGAANAARARRRESFFSLPRAKAVSRERRERSSSDRAASEALQESSVSDAASDAVSDASSASDAPRLVDEPRREETKRRPSRVEAGASVPGSGSRKRGSLLFRGHDEDVRRLRATLWEWRDALADGASAADVDALVEAMTRADGREASHSDESTSRTNGDGAECRFVVAFAPGARVLAAGTVSSASLLVIAGSVEERDVLRDVRDEREKRFHPSSGARCFGSRRDGGVFISRAGPGRFAGERAYFERCAPDAEDAFARASDVPTGEGASSDPRAHQSRDAARRRDAFAHEEKGCTLIVFEHSALDRLRERAPGFALAMFARMAANAVEKEIIGAGSTVS